MKAPTQCVLWSEPALVLKPADVFDVVETFIDESHHTRRLLRCRECRQLYFAEFYEEVDWDDGDDSQFTTYIPLETTAEIEALKKASPMDLLQYGPRLQRDFPKDAKGPTARWIS